MAIDDDRTGFIRAHLDRPLVLIGMMGSGKSKLGRMLAERLDLPFTDSDDEIERAAGCSIADIFERYGEPFFRDGERRVIGRLLDKKTGVIATGGGAPMQAETAERIWAQSVSIWVRTDLPVLVERVSRNADRPLLKDGDPSEILGRLLETRTPVYQKADIIVDSRNGPASVAAAEALEKLEAYLRDGQQNAKRHAE